MEECRMNFTGTQEDTLRIERFRFHDVVVEGNFFSGFLYRIITSQNYVNFHPALLHRSVYKLHHSHILEQNAAIMVLLFIVGRR